MILIDASPLQSEHRHRGVGTYVARLTQEMVKRSEWRDVRFLVESKGLQALPRSVRERSIVMNRPHKPAQVYWIYNELVMRRALRRCSPALFHATDFNGLLTTGGMRTLATVYDMTGFEEGDHSLDPSLLLSRWRWHVYYRTKLPTADHVIAISSAVRNEIVRRLGYPATKVTVVPLGVALDEFRPQRDSGRFSGMGPYIAYAGSHETHKNVRVLIEAFARVATRIPDLNLFVCGRWPKESVAWLIEKTEKMGIRSKVRHFGYVEHQDQVSLYSNAKAFVFPSLKEGFGLPILEAMACGTPVIASNIPVFEEVAGAAAVLVEPTSVERLASEIVDMVTDGARARAYTIMGMERAAQFGWSKVADRTMDTYEELLKR